MRRQDLENLRAKAQEDRDMAKNTSNPGLTRGWASDGDESTRDPLVTCGDAARQKSASKHTVYKAVERGELAVAEWLYRASVDGGVVPLIRMSDVLAWVPRAKGEKIKG